MIATILLCLAGHPGAPDPCETHHLRAPSLVSCLMAQAQIAGYVDLRGFRIERVTCEGEKVWPAISAISAIQ